MILGKTYWVSHIIWEMIKMSKVLDFQDHQFKYNFVMHLSCDNFAQHDHNSTSSIYHRLLFQVWWTYFNNVLSYSTSKMLLCLSPNNQSSAWQTLIKKRTWQTSSNQIWWASTIQFTRIWQSEMRSLFLCQKRTHTCTVHYLTQLIPSYNIYSWAKFISQGPRLLAMKTWNHGWQSVCNFIIHYTIILRGTVAYSFY